MERSSDKIATHEERIGDIVNSVPKGKNLNRLWSYLIVDTLAKFGATKFFISPGLRNAPLVAAVLEHPELDHVTGIDERSMAYAALGYSKAKDKPAVLLCTSGTALGNYYPAIIEAYKTGVPLVVLSADRPFGLVAANGNQTIEQDHFFEKWVAASGILGEVTQDFIGLKSKISTLMKKCLAELLPVHINVPLDEPLTNSLEEEIEEIRPQLLKVLDMPVEVEAIKTKFDQSFSVDERTAIVVGELSPGVDLQSVRESLQPFENQVFVDISSSLKNHYKGIDSLLLNREFITSVVHLGGRVISKEYFEWIHDERVSFFQFHDRVHAFYKLAGTGELFNLKKGLPSLLNGGSNRSFDQKEISQNNIEQVILDQIPGSHNLYLGNSSVVRNFDVAKFSEGKSNRCYLNRGVSGIEGGIASAVGVTIATERQTTAVIGDVSFLHDLGSLQLISRAETPMVLVIINNGGGKIFTKLPISEEKEVLEVVSTPHEKTFRDICKQFVSNYESVKNLRDFTDAYKKALQLNEHCIIEYIEQSEEK